MDPPCTTRLNLVLMLRKVYKGITNEYSLNKEKLRDIWKFGTSIVVQRKGGMVQRIKLADCDLPNHRISNPQIECQFVTCPVLPTQVQIHPSTLYSVILGQTLSHNASPEGVLFDSANRGH